MLSLLVLMLAGASDPDRAPTLRDVDGRMATIAWRLQTRNVALCRDLQPAPGFQLHAIDQYPRAIQVAWTASGTPEPVQVEAVVAGSPAAAAGVMADDALIAVNGVPVAAPAAAAAATSATRDAANALIARQPVGQPLALTIRRSGTDRVINVAASAGCRSAFEVLLDGGFGASSSEGGIVQVGVRFFETLPDDKIAAVVAHELSHAILDHSARKDAAGVKWGLLSEVGRNARLTRRTEDDADLLSVHLLHNAGYDPQAAVRFWREDGGKVDWGLLRGPSHGSPKARAAAIAAEIATLPPPGTPDDHPAVLATRDQPLK